MRRLLRWTFNALAAASLLLCLATAVLWVRSYWVNDQLYARRPDASGHGRVHYGCFVWSDRGRLGGTFVCSARPEAGPIPPWEFFSHGAYVQTALDFGFNGNPDVDFVFNARAWEVPYWSLVAAFAVLPAIFAFRQIRAVRRRRHRSRLGLCPACGYDLRASPGRCPECGRGR